MLAILLAAFAIAAPAAKTPAATVPVASSASPAKPSPEPPVFRARLVEDLGTLDWNYGEVNHEVVYQLMEGLFRADHEGKPRGAAARWHRWNGAKTELTLQLNPELRWSDGAPVCAQHFVDSWARLRDKKFASPYAHFANVLKRFEARSCRELFVAFERPAPEAPALFSHFVFFPIRLDALKAHPQAFRDGRGLLVNGPFRLAQWERNRKITLERNPFSPRPARIKGAEFFFVPDDATAKVMFEQKRLDWVKDVPALLRTPALEKGREFRIFPAYISFYFGLNTASAELLRDSAVRRALHDALDRGELTKVLGREVAGTRAWLPAKLFAAKVPAASQDFTEARNKLAAAKAAGTMNLVLRVYDKSAHKLLAEWAQGQWEKKLGVRIPVEVQEGKVYWRELYTDTAPIFLGGVTAPYAHPRAFLQEFLTASTANWTGWSSAAFDAAVAEENFQRAEELLREGGQVIPLYTRDTAALVARSWQGFHVNPLGQVFLSELSF